jgi:transcriptional regulator with XRE-family HTH domain
VHDGTVRPNRRENPHPSPRPHVPDLPARPPANPPAALWTGPDMRQALACHDIATVFRLLQRHGVSQRRLAAAAGMSQSEVSEIMRGRRVVSYDVLLRISQGLSIPRGWLGLAFDDATAHLLGICVDEEVRPLLAKLLELLTPRDPATTNPEVHCGTDGTPTSDSDASVTQPGAA